MPKPTEPHPALSHRCPFCRAEPGQPCRTVRGNGRKLDSPHSRRRALVNPLPAKPPINALCCNCGNLRTVSANYYFGPNDENRGGALFTDPRGWRNTGTLKCSQCRTRTRHALEAGNHFAEQYQRYALGGSWPHKYAPDLDRLRAEYFEQFPRNPNLNHWYVIDEAQASWDAGERTVAALCGEPMSLHRRPGTSSRRVPMTELVEPDEMRDMEYEDAETGLSWVDMECVNCLRVTNTRRLALKRTELLTQLLELTATVGNLEAAKLIELQEHVERLLR